MKTNTTKKVISILLSIFMFITMAPLSAFAFDADFEADYEMQPNETLTVAMPENTTGKGIYIKFVPDVDGLHKFVSQSDSSGDPRAVLYDANEVQLTVNDDSNGLDFELQYSLEAGVTYYIYVTDIDWGIAREWKIISIAPCTSHTGGTQTCAGYKCEVCEEWYGEGTDNHADEDGNGLCDVCNAFLGNEIKAGEPYTVTKKEYVKFVPTESGNFIISSVSDVDPRVRLYDSNMSYLDTADDSEYREENSCDFRLKYEYTAGETYYFELHDYDGEYNYTVYLTAPCTEHSGGTQTCMGYECEVCGTWYGEADENKHGWYFGICEYCNIEYPEDLECEHFYSPENDFCCVTCGVACPHETMENGACTDCLYSLPFSLTTGENVTYHDSFLDALDKAEDGSVIKLLTNYSDESNYEINKAITLDLNGKELFHPSLGRFTINAHVIFTDSVGVGYSDYGLNLNCPVTFNGGSYRYISIDFETEDTLDDYLADGYDYFDRETDEVIDSSSAKQVDYAVIKFNDRFTGIKDNHFYKHDIMQKAYQLVEFEGDFYFIGDRHEIIKNRTAYLTEARINGLTYADGTEIAVGLYEFDENGKMVMREGIVGNKVYKNNTLLKAYQLVEVDGDFYFIGDRHEIIKNRTAYLTETRINGLTYADGTPITVGLYEFDENGKMVIRNGIVGNHIYKNNAMLKAYQLVEVDGDFYFIGDRHEIIKNRTAYLTETRINGLTYADGTPITVGLYEFDENGKMIIE